MLIGCALLAVMTMRGTSVTIDEFGNLPRGLWVWRYGDFQLDSGTTPLPSMLAAAPVALTATPPLRTMPNVPITPWTVGGQFMDDNEAHYRDYYAAARTVTVIVLLGTCLAVWALARRLYGETAALIALFVACFTPDLLAHGTLVTMDLYLAASVLGALWAFDAFWQRPVWQRASVLGATVGIATLCKFTGVMLFALLPLAAVLMSWLRRFMPHSEPAGDNRPRAVALGLALAGVVAIITINAGYATLPFSYVPLGSYTFSAPTLTQLQGWLPAWWPVPLPHHFVQGIDVQLSEPPYDAYLLGEFNVTGFWNYYLVGLLVKTPEAILVLAVAALVVSRRIQLRELPLIVVGLGGLVFLSVAGHKNTGMRYVLFLAPIAAIWIGRLAAARLWTTRPRLTRGATFAICAWLGVTTAVACPHYLGYFNAASGGTANGHTYLLDSNLDWGQGLVELREYMTREHIDEIDLAYAGRVNPYAIYGIPFHPLWDTFTHRHVAISANLLWGRGYWIFGTGHGMTERDQFATLRSMTPEAILGGSMYVFDLGARRN